MLASRLVQSLHSSYGSKARQEEAKNIPQVIQMVIKAKYENGVFKPLEDVDVKEGTEADVYVRSEKGNGRKPVFVRELGFFGMWKNRDDIGTGTEY